MDHQWEEIGSLSIPVSSDDLEWPWKAEREVQHFPADLCNYSRTVWPRMTTFGKVTQLREEIFLLGYPCPHPKGAGSQRPQFFGTPTYAHMVWPRATKFGMITHGSVFPEGHPHPIPMRGLQRPASPNFLGFLYACTQHETQQPNFAWWSNQMWGNVFQGRPRPLRP